jgi:uncharacterized membrane protein YcjF (UPF0283 family)
MTPETQAFLEAKFTANYWNQVAMLSLIGAILVSKLLIYWQMIRLFDELLRVHREQKVQHGQHDQTHAKLDHNTSRKKLNRCPTVW